MSRTPGEMPNTLIGTSIVTASYGQALANAVLAVLTGIEARRRERIARKLRRRQRRDTERIIAGLPAYIRADLGARQRDTGTPGANPD